MVKTLFFIATFFSLSSLDFQTKVDYALPTNSQFTTKAADACALSAPSTFTGTRTSSTTASLQWSAVSSAIAYKLTVYELDPSTLFSNTVEYGTSTTLSSLQSWKSYRFYLSSICSAYTVSEFIIIIDITE